MGEDPLLLLAELGFSEDAVLLQLTEALEAVQPGIVRVAVVVAEPVDRRAHSPACLGGCSTCSLAHRAYRVAALGARELAFRLPVQRLEAEGGQRDQHEAKN